VRLIYNDTLSIEVYVLSSYNGSTNTLADAIFTNATMVLNKTEVILVNNNMLFI
jgi:hypothetical protein